jgi:hypothetical protein
LMWADRHFQRTGMWPTRRSGAVIDAPGETWRAIDLALNRGNRGLPSGRSLPQLFAEHISCAGQNRGSCLESIIVVQRAAPWRVVSKWQVRHAAKQAPQRPAIFQGLVCAAKPTTPSFRGRATRAGRRYQGDGRQRAGGRKRDAPGGWKSPGRAGRLPPVGPRPRQNRSGSSPRN